MDLQEALQARTYRPGAYRTFVIREKKPRLLRAAPFRDRVVHHALCHIIEPLFERGFVDDSYACRKGKGTHAAIDRASRYAGRYSYVLKCDLAQFFPSIDHQVLRGIVQRRLWDVEVLELIDLILRHGRTESGPVWYFPGDDLYAPWQRARGLPIGNQTSQFFGNVYLDPLDHFVKESLHCKQENLAPTISDFQWWNSCRDAPVGRLSWEFRGHCSRMMQHRRRRVTDTSLRDAGRGGRACLVRQKF